jgi:hypothetical protein
MAPVGRSRTGAAGYHDKSAGLRLQGGQLRPRSALDLQLGAWSYIIKTKGCSAAFANGPTGSQHRKPRRESALSIVLDGKLNLQPQTYPKFSNKVRTALLPASSPFLNAHPHE